MVYIIFSVRIVHIDGMIFKLLDYVTTSHSQIRVSDCM